MNTYTIAIIGVGGIGSRIALEMAQHGHNLVLIDFDTYEQHNRTRQPLAHLYEPGTNKATAHVDHLSQIYDQSFIAKTKKLTPESRIIADFIIIAVDTSEGRNTARTLCLEHGLPFLTVANETDDGEACLMIPEWQDTPKDPWVTWPDLYNPDPPDRGPSCTTDATIEKAPQTPNTNQLMASLAVWITQKFLDTDCNPTEFQIIRAIATEWNVKTIKANEL